MNLGPCAEADVRRSAEARRALLVNSVAALDRRRRRPGPDMVSSRWARRNGRYARGARGICEADNVGALYALRTGQSGIRTPGTFALARNLFRRHYRVGHK